MSMYNLQWPLSLHRKTAKLLNMALILLILKILQKKHIFFFINIVPADIFCLITFVVKWNFFLTKNQQKMQKCP